VSLLVEQMASIQGIVIGCHALNHLKRGNRGEVYSVHEDSFYCLLPDNQLLLICNRKYGGIPFGILVNDIFVNHFRPADLVVGMKVHFAETYLYVPEANFYLALGKAKLWVPTEKNNIFFSIPRLTSNLISTVQIGKEVSSSSVLGKLSLFQRDLFSNKENPSDISFIFYNRALNPLSQFIKGVEEKNFPLVLNSLTKLIGLGIGLTPSMDDVIIGFVSALFYLQQYLGAGYVSAIGGMVYVLSRGKTTLISETFLRFACGGERYEIIDNIIYSLLSSEGEDLKSHIYNLLSVGNTSGTELLLGIVLGLRLVLRSIIKE